MGLAYREIKAKERGVWLMDDGITIISREWITDPQELRGRKEVIVYLVRASSLIDNILTTFPHTGEGSFAICIPEGICRNLIDGVWV
jgi:hypothetical protein